MFLTEEYLQNSMYSKWYHQYHNTKKTSVMVCIFKERDVECMRVSYLSELSQGSFTHGCFTPVKTPALNKKAGAHRASDPVTKATAVKPNVDRTKLGLKKRKKKIQALDGERHLVQERNKQSMQITQQVAQESHTSLSGLLYIFIFPMWTQWN